MDVGDGPPKHAGDWRFRLVPHPPGKIILFLVEVAADGERLDLVITC